MWQDLIVISGTSQSSVLDYIEVRGSIEGYTTSNHDGPANRSCSATQQLLTRSFLCLLDTSTTIIKVHTKFGLACEKDIPESSHWDILVLARKCQIVTWCQRWANRWFACPITGSMESVSDILFTNSYSVRLLGVLADSNILFAMFIMYLSWTAFARPLLGRFSLEPVSRHPA